MRSSRIEGPGLDMLETERHARLEKGESRFRHIVSFLVIGVYSEINNITGFLLI
jgi:hypothetical protein